MNLFQIFLEALAALAFTSGAYTSPPVVEPPACQEDEPCWDCETMGNGVCGEAVVTWTEGPATLTGLYVQDAPGSTRLMVTSIRGAAYYTVVCDTFTAGDVSAANAVAVLNGPDGTCHVV